MLLNGVVGGVVRWTATALWMAVIFALSSVPGSAVPGRFGPLAHAVEYAILGSLLLWAIGKHRPGLKDVQASTLVASLYAVTDEVHQAFVPGRTPDVVDWGVDTLGALVGALALAYIIRKAASRRPSSTYTEPPER